MLEPPCKEAIARQVRMPQIIVAALVAGLVVFLAIVVVLVRQGFAGAPDIAPILTYVAIANAVIAGVARLIVPNIIVTRARRHITQGTWQMAQSPYVQSGHGQTVQEDFARFLEQTGDAGRLFCVFQTRTIVAGAILEGAAFLALVMYLIEHSPLALILAVILMIALAAHFPTRAGVIRWIEEQLRLVELQRQFDG